MNTQKHIPIATPFADSIVVNTDNFDGILSATEDTVQKVLDVIDNNIDQNVSIGEDVVFGDILGEDVIFESITGSDIIIDTENPNDIVWDTTSAVNQSFTGTMVRDAGGASVVIQGRRARSGPASLNNTNQMVKLRALAWDSDISNYGLSGEITFSADGGHSGTDIPCQMKVRLAPDGPATARDVFRLRADGSVEMPLDDQYLKFGALNTDLQIGSDGTNGIINVNESLIVNKALIVNSDNQLNTGITLQGSGPVSEAGGTIIWHSNSIISEIGHNYLNDDYKLVFDTSAQASPGDTGNAWIAFDTGDANFGSVTATEYHGGSDIKLKEDGVFFGANDNARIFVDTNSPWAGDAWRFQTDDLQITHLVLKSPRIVLDAGGGTVGDILIHGNNNEFKWQRNSRAWMDAVWAGADREVRFATDIAFEQKELPVTFLNKHTGAHMLQIKGLAGTVSLHGDITLDPRDGGFWPTAKVVMGGPTNNIEINGYGDVNFVSGGGLQFGEICYHDGGFNIVLAAQDTDYQVIGFNTNGESNGNVTPDYINDHITLGDAGRYQVSFSGDVRSATSNVYEFHVMYNNGASNSANTHAHRHTTIANKIGPIVMNPAFVDFPAGATVELWVRRNDGGGAAKTITIERMNLSVMQVGGRIAA